MTLVLGYTAPGQLGEIDIAGGGGTSKTLKQQRFTTSDTWVRPAGVDSVQVLLVAGGAPGGRYAGGAGGCVKSRVLAVDSDVSVVIGAGAISDGTTDGGAGGDSSFGTLLTCAGGLPSNTGSGGPSAGEGSGGGGVGNSFGSNVSVASSGLPGSCGFGGGGGGRDSYRGLSYGGSDGGGGGAGSVNAAPNTGGGGGAPFGNGADGICVVTWWE